MSLYRRRRWRWTDRVLLIYASAMALVVLFCIGSLFGMLLAWTGVGK